MRAYVFTDRSLERHAGQFVWLSINTELSTNAGVVEKYPVAALPTYFVVDPVEEKSTLRWVGGASLAQLHAMLDVASARAAGTGGTEVATADADLAIADRLYGEGRDAEAADTYERAIAEAPPDWPSYGRAVESALFAYDRADEPEPGSRLALAAYPRLVGTISSANVAASGLSHAVALPEDFAPRAGRIDTLERYVREVIADTTLDISGDELSGVYIALYESRQEAGDEAGSRQVAEAWAAQLERAAARATTPEQRTVYDSHRLSAYLELGEPERAIPMLEQSRADFPDDYNPYARLALAYRDMKRWPESIAASQRALEMAYGPRRLLVFIYHSRILAASGDTAAAIAAIEHGLAYADSLPEPQRSKGRIAALERQLATLRP